MLGSTMYYPTFQDFYGLVEGGAFAFHLPATINNCYLMMLPFFSIPKRFFGENV
jgi:hypothetical protein